MALPDDPRGSRRGQIGNDPAGDRRSNGRQQQPSFSNYRPEAYANEKRGNGRAPDWQQAEPQFRTEAPAPERSRQQHHDPYSAGGDPYDAGHREFEAGGDWQSSGNYPDQQASQFAASSYYEPQAAPEAQSMHDRFFSAEPEPVRAPRVPQQPAPAPRYQADDFGADDFHPEERPAPRPVKPAPSAAPPRGFEDSGGDYRWDNFDQQAAPEPVRSFQNAKLGPEEDLDADYFADEEEFDGDEDFTEPKGAGSKRLMAAVLVGAVVTGGGLAYLYKSQAGTTDSGEPPIMVADPRPVKEQPADPGGRQFSNGSKLIYDRLEGSAGPEEPTRLAATATATDISADKAATIPTGGTLEERIQNALRDAKKQDDTSALDTPRPVKTETIRPDGSVDGARTQRAAAAAPAQAAAAATPAARRQVAAIAPAAAAATPPAATSGGEAGMFVQIAARNDEAAARAAFVDLKQKYAGVLGNYSPSVKKVDLGDKGVWFRLLVGPMPSKVDADKLCEDLKTAGMKGCFSRKE